MPTIAAEATPKGMGGISVIRISGPESLSALKALFRTHGVFTPGFMRHGKLISPSGEIIDDCMAVYFKKPNSYTGEDAAELYLHGSPVTVRRAMEALADTGVRPAGPGEFTKRAFLAGKMDLSQAESVMELIGAESLYGAREALRHLEGYSAKALSVFEDEIELLLSHIGAAADYPEDDLDESVLGEIAEKTAILAEKADKLIEKTKNEAHLRDGIYTVLQGVPNAGKSSLFNAILGFSRSIVTPVAGTTRDAVSENVEINGVRFYIVDTAGLRDGGDDIERIGVDIAKNETVKADLIIRVIDGSLPFDAQKEVFSSPEGVPVIEVLNKSDLSRHADYGGSDMLEVSALTGEGLDELKSRMAAVLPVQTGGGLGSARQAECLMRAKDSLLLAREAALSGMPPDCAAVDLREAALALGEITGKNVDENVIDNIFSKFCVGK